MPAGSRAAVNELFASPEPTDDQIRAVTAIVTDEGGIEYARRRATAYAFDAEEALAGLPESPVLTALHDAIAYAVERTN